jgi:hypothetical protein
LQLHGRVREHGDFLPHWFGPASTKETKHVPGKWVLCAKRPIDVNCRFYFSSKLPALYAQLVASTREKKYIGKIELQAVVALSRRSMARGETGQQPDLRGQRENVLNMSNPFSQVLRNSLER